MQITIPPTDVEMNDMETTYQPRIVELEGYDIDIAEYVDADTGIEYLIAIGPIGLAMCPRLQLLHIAFYFAKSHDLS